MRTDTTVVTLPELCEATGASQPRIEFFVRLGVVVPGNSGRGRGNHRVYNVENILEASLAEELMKARFTGYQLQKVATTLRAAIAHLSPPERMVARFRHYIATVQHLADIFGKDDGFDAWLRVQTQQLQRMERALAKVNTAGLDNKVRQLVVALKPSADDSSALVG